MDDYIDPKVSAEWRPRISPNRHPAGAAIPYPDSLDHDVQWKWGDQRRLPPARVSRRPVRRLWHQRGEVDRSNLGEYLPLLNEHIEQHLKAKFARILRLQLIHVAAGADVKHGVTVMRGSDGPEGFDTEVVENYFTQRCADCLKQVPLPEQILIFGSQLPASVDENECWPPGQRLLERMEGRMITDWRWWALEPGEQPPPGFIPCKAAFEAL